MAYIRHRKLVENILLKKVLNKISEAEASGKIAVILENPLWIADSPLLDDNDLWKKSAVYILEDFEAVTNGMSRPGSPGIILEEKGNPLYSWHLLTNAIASFYENNFVLMEKFSSMIPENTPPAVLKEVFSIISGKPSSSKKALSFAMEIFSRNTRTSESIELLQEASAYRDILITEIQKVIPLTAKENLLSAKKLYYWAVSRLVQEEPLSEYLEKNMECLGPGEASRLCSVASMQTDPDYALLAWLRSFKDVLWQKEISKEEITARSTIASELIRNVKSAELFTEQINSAAADIIQDINTALRNNYSDISLPDIKLKLPSAIDSEKNNKRFKNTKEIPGLFGELSA